MNETWTFDRSDLGESDVRQLIDLHFRRMREGSPADACHVLPLDGLKDPAVQVWTLREGGRLLGVGALKSLEAGHGEIKSMRVADDALGRGAGRAILDHLTAEARRQGMTRLSLETGNSDDFAAANRLYERGGFARCGPFGGYRDTAFTHFYTRAI